MPYKSRAQQRLFHHLVAQGKLAPEVAEEYDTASKGKKLPQYVKRKAFGGQVSAKEGTHCPACDYPLDAVPVAMDAGEGCPRCGYGDAKDVPQRARGGEMLPKQGEESMEPTRYRARGGEIRAYADGGEVDHGLSAMTLQRGPSEAAKRAVRRLHVDDSDVGLTALAPMQQVSEATKRAVRRIHGVDRYAHGGEVKCAHCGSVEFVPLKAMGGEVGGPMHGDMKELYPSKKDAGAHLDDGKIRSFGKMFVHAIKHRRR